MSAERDYLEQLLELKAENARLREALNTAWMDGLNSRGAVSAALERLEDLLAEALYPPPRQGWEQWRRDVIAATSHNADRAKEGGNEVHHN